MCYSIKDYSAVIALLDYEKPSSSTVFDLYHCDQLNWRKRIWRTSSQTLHKSGRIE